MKRIFTLFSAILMSIAVLAEPPKARTMLTVQSFGRGDMKVVIDGHRFEPRENFMRLQGLKPGYHKIKIYRERTGGFYDLFGKRYEVVFKGSVVIRPRTNLILTVDRFGKVVKKESRFKGWNSGRNRRFDDEDRDYNRRNDVDWDSDFDKGHDFIFEDDGQVGDYNWDDHGNQVDRFNAAINDHEFNTVLQSISREWLESNKMKSATQVLNTHYFTSLQVRQMMQLFGMENNKVDLAKKAYPKTIDQRKFLSTVDDVLDYEASRDELARFIRNVR